MTDPVEKVQKALDELHYDGRIIHSDATIFTVEDASKAIGVTPGEILKSLIFMVDGQPWLVLMSGPNKAHSGKIKRLSQGHHVTMASPTTFSKISASGSAACRPSATRRRFPRCWTRICGITPSSGPRPAQITPSFPWRRKHCANTPRGRKRPSKKSRPLRLDLPTPSFILEMKEQKGASHENFGTQDLS